MSNLLRKSIAFATPVALGALALFAMIQARSEPSRRPPEEQGRPVRVLTIAEHTATPRATGYGVVRSQREWKLVAEVSGRVVELSDKLETGRILKQGEKLLKIDPQAYRITASQQKATVANARAQLSELTAKERNTNASLKIAERSLELSRKDFARSKQLFASGTVSETQVDEAERKMLNDQTSVQNLKNALAQMPANRRALKAQAAQYRAGVAGAELDISRTDLVVPFDVRIRSVNVTQSELVSVGKVLAEGDGINVAEVPAHFSIGSLAPLIRGAQPSGPRGSAAISPSAINRLPVADLLTATIHLESGALSARWQAQVDRFENVDSETRTISVVVTVDKPFERTRPGVQPPLVRGMYVEVELRGLPRAGCRAVPRAALHGNKVHIVDADNRLEIRPVEIDFMQDTYACIDTGIKPGEVLVLTNLVPAINGMLLAPQDDRDATNALRRAVKGRGSVPQIRTGIEELPGAGVTP